MAFSITLENLRVAKSFMNLKLKMKSPLTKLLSVIAACGLATSAYGLTIIPTFDVSITTNANVVGITNAINAAIGVLQSNVVDNVTVNITFVSDESVGLGQSATFGDDVAYADFLTALKSHAASVTDTNALSKLPSSTTDPVVGGTQIHLTTAQARVLGLDNSILPADSIVACKMSSMNFTRPGLDPTKYDLQATIAHEINEVLGISSGLPTTNEVWPADLFRYTTNLVRTYTTNADDAYFSPDGTNLVARYNMEAGGDYGDWWSATDARWAPPGVTPTTQVQDAFGLPGVIDNMGVSEYTILDVVGWTLATTTTATTPPTLNIVGSGANQFTLSWTNTASGFVLQERTNLISGAWAFSTTGATNPAVIGSTDLVKFYRLYKPAVLGQQPVHHVAAVPVAHGPLTITIRSLQPRQH
jgi:hypothetical protein